MNSLSKFRCGLAGRTATVAVHFAPESVKKSLPSLVWWSVATPVRLCGSTILYLMVTQYISDNYMEEIISDGHNNQPNRHK
jgi:hypothetical protein